MTGAAQTPEGRVADAVAGNWVDTHAPGWSRPYLRLSRADRPIGTWLLLIPCLWAVLLSAASGDGLGWQGAWVIAGCAAGAWLMRGAGCTWNDITDRHIDAAVTRTRSRPIPAGDVTAVQAFKWCCIQSLIAFCILLSFNDAAILLGIAALAPVCVYPFAKRFTWWPQAFLGIAFNWGALLAWAAHDGGLGWPALGLYLGGIAWTLFYDTIYAHQDREDDALIGVRSTARLFAENTPRWLWRFHIATVAALAVAVGIAFGPDGRTLPLVLCLAGVAAMGGHLAWQMRRVDFADPESCLTVFRSNRDAGLLPVAFFALALLL